MSIVLDLFYCVSQFVKLFMAALVNEHNDSHKLHLSGIAVGMHSDLGRLDVQHGTRHAQSCDSPLTPLRTATSLLRILWDTG